MDPLELLQVAADTLERLGVPYLVTGSMATMAYGEARFTNDFDYLNRGAHNLGVVDQLQQVIADR